MNCEYPIHFSKKGTGYFLYLAGIDSSNHLFVAGIDSSNHLFKK